MSKKKGYRAETMIVDEAIPVEVEEEVLEAMEETVVEEPTPKMYTVTCAGTVIPWTLNVRKRPSADSEILKVLRFKDDVEILDENTANGWLSVLLADGTKGYCMEKFIKIIN